MIDVRIVCAYDAVKTASAIKRLLNAEGFNAEIAHGRGSLGLLEDSCANREAVLLVWSLDAPTTDYMHKWAAAVDPIKLAEIARAPMWPPLEGRRANVIDFSSWNGERGGPAWRAMEDRLRHIARAMEPKRPPPFAPALALAGFGLMGAVAGIVARLDQTEPVASVQFEQPQLAEMQPELGWGGPLTALEPESMSEEDASPMFGRIRTAPRALEPVNFEPLQSARVVAPMQYRDANLLDRLSDWTAPIIGANGADRMASR